MKGIVIFIAAILVFGAMAGVFYYFYFVKAGGDAPVKISSDTDIKGSINFVDIGSGMMNVKTESGDKNLAINNDTKLLDDNNNPVDIGFYQKGFDVEAKGVAGSDNSLKISEIKAISFPNIIILSPERGDLIGGNLIVRGKARVFENQFNIRIVSGGQPVYETSATSSAKDAGLFGDFLQTINIGTLNLSGSDFILEVFDKSAKDGSETNKVSVLLSVQAGDQVGVRVYFNNNKIDSGSDCGKVYPVSRVIQKTNRIGNATLEELLKGPTSKEKDAGYFTGINPDTRMNSPLSVDQNTGMAFVDFNEALESGVAGSCRVTAIRAQISQTLKQFSTIQNVIISINGNSTSTLQP
ncbi:MAG: GerMN domain-containing protein [Candidatus Wolfebacteria bacterium]|nr:GerMN domain-containing protein [Candidatus Wolfebacteria bacterium]